MFSPLQLHLPGASLPVVCAFAGLRVPAKVSLSGRTPETVIQGVIVVVTLGRHSQQTTETRVYGFISLTLSLVVLQYSR